MADPELFDADQDDAFDAYDLPADQIDWPAVLEMQHAIDDANDPDTVTSPIEVLQTLYGSDLRVP